MSEKRFTTNGYYINDTYHDGRRWLVNEVEAKEIVNIMNGLDTKARESRKAISKLQKENKQLKKEKESWKSIACQDLSKWSIFSNEVSVLYETRDIERFLEKYYEYCTDMVMNDE